MLLKLGTGNGERGTGNREQEFGNESRVYSGNRPENSKWRTKEKARKLKGTIWGNMRKCHGCKREFLPAVSLDDQYVLVRAEADWY